MIGPIVTRDQEKRLARGVDMLKALRQVSRTAAQPEKAIERRTCSSCGREIATFRSKGTRLYPVRIFTEHQDKLIDGKRCAGSGKEAR